MRKFLLGASALALASGLAGAAQAVPVAVAVAFKQDAGFVQTTPVNSLVPGSYTYSASTANYTFNGSMIGSPLLPQGYFDTTNVNVEYTGESGLHILDVWITQSNLSSPQGTASFTGGFTTNTWTSGTVEVIEEVRIDPLNNLFFSGTQVGQQDFMSPVSAMAFASTPVTLNGLYSETVHYTIRTNAAGASSNNTIDITVPEPASLGLVGVGLAALGFLRRRDKNNDAAAPIATA
jgi:hypothetical protein